MVMIFDSDGAHRSPQLETGAPGTCEAVLCAWLSGLDSFRKKVLSATLQTFDTPLTALCFVPRIGGQFQADRIHNIPCLLLFEVAAGPDRPFDGDMHRSHILAVAAADSDAVRIVLSAQDGQVALLPLTLEVLNYMAQAGN